MPWDHGNVVRWNHVHEVDGILGDGGSIYTLGVQGNRPFRAGSVRKAYPAVPEPPLKILPMSQMVSNFAHNNGWPERTCRACVSFGSAGVLLCRPLAIPARRACYRRAELSPRISRPGLTLGGVLFMLLFHEPRQKHTPKKGRRSDSALWQPLRPGGHLSESSTGPKNSRKGDGTHGPGGVYTDNGSTGWNVSGNVFKSLTVWAVACCEPILPHPPPPAATPAPVFSCYFLPIIEGTAGLHFLGDVSLSPPLCGGLAVTCCVGPPGPQTRLGSTTTRT